MNCKKRQQIVQIVRPQNQRDQKMGIFSKNQNPQIFQMRSESTIC